MRMIGQGNSFNRWGWIWSAIQPWELL